MHRETPRTPRIAAPAWPLALTAAVGAWLGHVLEYVRSSGWHTGLAEMSSSVHLYFLPAGAVLAVLVLAAGAAAARSWASLGRRLVEARATLRTPNRRHTPNCETPPPTSRRRPVPKAGIGRVWISLTALQVAIWTVQENVETVAAGHHAPLLGVVSGGHLLAPVVQAEVALILAVVFVTIRRRFHHRVREVHRTERLASRKWRRSAAPVLATQPLVFALTPHDRWGAQRWERPPPAVDAA